jgi:hypothetical protein
MASESGCLRGGEGGLGRAILARGSAVHHTRQNVGQHMSEELTGVTSGSDPMTTARGEGVMNCTKNGYGMGK